MTDTITSRIDNTTRIPDSHLSPTPPAPRSVKIELSPRCNYRCGFCALRTREHQPKHDMDFGLFRKITADMADNGVQEIGLFYLGESMMNVPLLVESIRYLKDQLQIPYVFLTSNASLAKPHHVEAMMKAGLDSLKWSMNACDEQQFKEVMGVSPKLFKTALSNVANAFAIRNNGKHATKLYASSIRYDGEQQARMEAFLDAHVRPFVDEHYWLPLYSMGAFAADREAELGFKPTAGNQGRLGALRDPLPCWSAFTEGHVTADGKLSACCFDANANWTMGDLTKQSFMEAWHSLPFRQLREAHLARDVTGTVCEACVAY